MLNKKVLEILTQIVFVSLGFPTMITFSMPKTKYDKKTLLYVKTTSEENHSFLNIFKHLVFYNILYTELHY